MDTIELNKYVGPYYAGLAPGTQPVILSSKPDSLTDNHQAPMPVFTDCEWFCE